jgi:hypothetical protein
MPMPHPARDDLALMTIRADTLFTYDARGRMVLRNSPANRPAQRLFLGRTINGHVVRFGELVPDAVAQQLATIVERQPPVDDLRVPASLMAALRETLERHAPVSEEGGGPAYRFPDAIVRPADVVEVTDANRDLVRDTFPWLFQDIAGWAPCFAVVRDGAAVSVCYSSRIGREAMEAGVDTLPDARGRGYAAAVTAAWGASVRASGRIPLYSTWWENLASQGVARRLGLIMYGADAHWT